MARACTELEQAQAAVAALYERWQELERKWSKLEAKVKQLGDAAAESTGDVRAAAELLGQEIKAGFKRIARQL